MRSPTLPLGSAPRSAAPEPVPLRPGVQRSFDELGTPLAEVTFCVLDLETTGSSVATCSITEIGAVKVRGGECLGTFHTLVNPGCAVPPHWLVYFAVRDCDGATALAQSLGGAVRVPPSDAAGMGRFSVLADPQGAVFAALEPRPT